jgi:quinol monooxygenase YgiN
MKAKADRLEELKKLFREYVATIRKNEPGNIMFNMHHQKDDPTALFFYEAYKDRATWSDIHMKQPYVAELGKVVPDYLEGDMDMEEFEQFD